MALVVSPVAVCGLATTLSAVEETRVNDGASGPVPASVSSGGVARVEVVSGHAGPTGGGSGASADPCAYTRAEEADLGGVRRPATIIIDGVRYVGFVKACPGSADVIYYIASLTAAQTAAQARDTMIRQLPKPMPQLSGGPDHTQYTSVPAILSVDPVAWKPLSITATALDVSATLTATPVALLFDPKDGSDPVRCLGPGQQLPAGSMRRPQYEAFEPDPGQCGYIYRTSSKDAPNLAFPAEFTIEWSASWSASDGASGTLAPIRTTSTVDVPVRKVQAVGGTGN